MDWLSIPHRSSNVKSPPPPVSFSGSAISTPPDETPQHFSNFNALFDQINGSIHSDIGHIDTESPEQVKRGDSDTSLYQKPESSLQEDPSVPLSLTLDKLTKTEARTYLRWYNHIIQRKQHLLRSKISTVTLKDVFHFLSNFEIKETTKHVLSAMFSKSAQSINIGQFFALLRLISHSLYDSDANPTRRMVQEGAPIPQPLSILCKRSHDSPEPEQVDLTTQEKLDLDSFTQFMLTGHRPTHKRKKNGKAVKFSDQVVIEPSSYPAPPPEVEVEGKLDLSLPMDQLLGKVNNKDEDEEAELRDMGDSISHFQNLSHIESTTLPSSNPAPQPLVPTATGSANHFIQKSMPPPPPPRHRSNSSPLSKPPPPPPRMRITSDTQRLSPLPPAPPRSRTSSLQQPTILGDLHALRNEVDEIKRMTDGH